MKGIRPRSGPNTSYTLFQAVKNPRRFLKAILERLISYIKEGVNLKIWKGIPDIAYREDGNEDEVHG